MSHVDEGELTAYADGAYPSHSSEAQRIEAHLAVCADCRTRLAQERALSTRAAEILAAATPIDITVPDFADVRAAADTVRRRRNALPLTWAASVILAIGLGWFGRGALFQPPGPRAAVSSTEAAPPDVTASAPEPAAPAPELRDASATGAAARRSAPALAPKRAELQAANSIDQATSLAASAEAPPSSVAEKAVAQEETRALAGVAAGMAVRDVDYMTPAEAERRGIALHAIPELEVLRVGVRNNEIVVEQKLPDGNLISITATQTEQALADRSAKPAEATPAAPLVARQRAALGKVAVPVVEITRGQTRLRISGPLAEDSLRALAARIR